MFRNFWDKIKGLFGRTPETTDEEIRRNQLFADNYNDAHGINIDAMICHKVAGIVAYESAANVTGANKGEANTRRVDQLDGILQRFWDTRFKKVIADTLGNGGVFVIPRYADGMVVEDCVAQDRVIINRAVNGYLIDISVIAERVVINAREYHRLTNHSLENGVYTIRQKATDQNGNEAPLSAVPKWAELTPEHSISGCDRLPVAFFKCPTSSRNVVTEYGVPVTYGQGQIIEEIKKMISMLVNEYERKETFVGMDERLFSNSPVDAANGEYSGNSKSKRSRRNKVEHINAAQKNGTFKLLHGDGDTPFWQIFDPAIRDASIINGVNFLLELLESGVGVSKGIMTKLESFGATATEIKNIQRTTAIFVADIRTMSNYALDNLVYAYNMIAEHWSLTPPGDYRVVTDWDLSYLESTTETFNQLMEAKTAGAVKLERINMYVTGQTEEEAAEEIAYVRANDPSLQDVLAMTGSE